MKKNYIIGAVVLACAVVAAIGGSVYYYENGKKLSSGVVQKQGKNKVKADKEISKESNKEVHKVEEVQKPNTLSKTIMEIDKENYDTYQWWNASESQLLEKLSSEAKEYKDAQIQSIVDNAKEIPSYLIRLAVMHPESIPYVAGYPTRKVNQPINIKPYYTPGKIPLFEQWDKQWGYDQYGEGPLATDGCGPTSLAMVAVGLTGNTSINPKVVADYSETHGGYVPGEGTSWSLMSDLGPHFGVKGTRISESQVIDELKAGHPVIAAMGPGTFTLTGHFMVLTGVTPDGKITLNDPDSIKYSNETWNFNQIATSARAYWSFTKIN